MQPPEPIEGLTEVTRKARRALWLVVLVAVAVAAGIWSMT